MKSHKTNTNKITHALNNHLTSVSLSFELLIKEFYGPLNAKQKKTLKSIISEVKKIKNLIKKIK